MRRFKEMYKQVSFEGTIINQISIEENGITKFINLDVDSEDKRLYESWLAEGNTPLPADS